MGRAGLAHRGGEVVGGHVRTHAELGRERLGGPGVHAGHHHVVDLDGVDAGGLEGAPQRVEAEGEVAGLAEPLLPHLGPALARGPPAVQELVGGRGAPQIARHDGGAGAVLAHHQRGGGVAPGRLVGARRAGRRAGRP